MMKKRLPEWLKRPIIDTENTRLVRKILRDLKLNTVCDNARCPNKAECYKNHTATFLIMGDTCTRNCRFCSVKTGSPSILDENEPKNVAIAIQKLNLQYAVITSVTRDDLEDGGAGHFAKTIAEIRRLTPDAKIEILTPDFKNNKKALDIIAKAEPDVFNHNVETVASLYSKVRPQADYQQSLDVLTYIKTKNPRIITKSGIMLGLGETIDELIQTFNDFANIDCDILTAGQYIQPTKSQLQVEKYYTEDEFNELAILAKKSGVKNTVFAPLVRSSYKAHESANSCLC